MSLDLLQQHFDRYDKIQARRKKSQWKHTDHTKWSNNIKEKLNLHWSLSKKVIEKIYFKKKK